MASLYKKVIGGKPYWYLREMAWVDGKPKLASERYLGTAAEIEALLDAREQQVLPDRLRHLGFGDVAAVWTMIRRLDVAGVIDEVVGPRRADAGASIGTYLALAALNRVVDPCSKLAFAQWWKSTAAERFTKVAAGVLEHRRFWDAMHTLTSEQLEQIEHALAVRIIDQFGVDTSSVALDMTNFATFIDSANPKAPIAQRGKAKQKRADLRLVGLGLVVTRDGGIPLVSHAYAGNKPDVTQFATVIGKLTDRHAAVAAHAGAGRPAQMTVVFDAGQNSQDNFDYLAALGLHYIGSVPPSDVPDLLAVPAGRRRVVDAERFGGLSALQTRREIYGTTRRVVLTHSPTLHAGQRAGFEQTLAKATGRLQELADRLARGKTRRDRPAVEREVEGICRDSWLNRVLSWQLTGDTPAELRLSFHIDPTARDKLEEEIFGKRVLITSRNRWPIAEVVAGYRSQSDAEFGFRQLKDRRVVSFAPMHHFTDQHIRVHLFTCVLALQLAHLMRREARGHGRHLSLRELLAQLAGIQETLLIYPSTGGRPRVRRKLTETTALQGELAAVFELYQWAPRT
jgi:transposase